MTDATCILKTHHSIFINLFEFSSFISFLNIQKTSFFQPIEMTLTMLQYIKLFLAFLIWIILNILFFNWNSFPHIYLFIISCFHVCSLCQFQITKLIEIGRAVWGKISALVWNIYDVAIIIIFISIIFYKIWNIIFILIFNITWIEIFKLFNWFLNFILWL